MLIQKNVLYSKVVSLHFLHFKRNLNANSSSPKEINIALSFIFLVLTNFFLTCTIQLLTGVQSEGPANTCENLSEHMMLSQSFHFAPDRVAAKGLRTVPSSILEISLSRSLAPEMQPTEHEEGQENDSRIFLSTSDTSAWEKPSPPSLAKVKHRKDYPKINNIYIYIINIIYIY